MSVTWKSQGIFWRVVTIELWSNFVVTTHQVQDAIIHPNPCFTSGSSSIYPMGPKNGLHVVGYNSAKSERIWMKNGTLWVNVWDWPWQIFGAIRAVATIWPGTKMFFTRVALAMRITIITCMSVCLCVCVCVTRRYCIKTAKRTITQTTPRDSPGTLVFWRQESLVEDPPYPWNLRSKWPTPISNTTILTIIRS